MLQLNAYVRVLMPFASKCSLMSNNVTTPALDLSIESVFGGIVLFLMLLDSCTISACILCVSLLFDFEFALLLCFTHLISVAHASLEKQMPLVAILELINNINAISSPISLGMCIPGMTQFFALGQHIYIKMTVWMCTYLFAFPVH